MSGYNASQTMISISHTIWAYLAELTVRKILVLILIVIAELALGSAIAAAGIYMMFTSPDRKRDSKRMANYLTHTVSLGSTSRNNRFVAGKETGIAFDFPSLPPEIRNQIMWYALVQKQHVYLPQIREVALLLPRKFRRRLPIFERLRNFFQCVYRRSVGYQISSHKSITKLPYIPPKTYDLATGLLAVNSQIYQQTHGIYWSANNFHLARGDFRNSQAFFENVAPEHLALIKNLTIDLSLADLTPPMLKYLEGTVPIGYGGQLPGNDNSNQWSLWASYLLWFIWKDKMYWVRKHFRHVPNIHIVCFEDPGMALKFTASELGDEMAEVTDLPPNKAKLGGLMEWARDNAGREIYFRVQEAGWDNFKELLAGGGWQRRMHTKVCPLPSEIRY